MHIDTPTAEEMEAVFAEEEAKAAADLWRYAMEFGAGSDALPETADYLRRIGTPEAMQVVRDIEAGRLALVELQLTKWRNAGLTTHAVNRDLASLAVANALPADYTEARALEELAALSEVDRLYYWLHPVA